MQNIRLSVTCPACSKPSKRFGKDKRGNQRFRCLSCGKTFQNPHPKILGNMIIAEPKALSVLSHLIEGCSVRTTERLTHVHRDTILKALLVAGAKCEALMRARISGLKGEDVECDVLWSYVGMKAKTRDKKLLTDFSIGDAWTFTATNAIQKLSWRRI